MFLFWQQPHTNNSNNNNDISAEIKCKLHLLHEAALGTRLVSKTELHQVWREQRWASEDATQTKLWHLLAMLAFVLLAMPLFLITLSAFFGVRCFVPNNNLVWEATRPASDCTFCKDVRQALILQNISRAAFAQYAYSSAPIVVKRACLHWPAAKVLSLQYFKRLYAEVPGAMQQQCGGNNLQKLQDIFEMPSNATNNKSWYIGWSACHAEILQKMRQLYAQPHFLPLDAELASVDYIFMGYEQGIGMQLNHLNRLSWQAQLQGNRSWLVAPAAECDTVCQSFSFYVEPGDIVLLDMRLWYHSTTTVAAQQFLLAIQSEYG